MSHIHRKTGLEELEEVRERKMFVVAILCKYGRGRHGNTYYGRWMASGINEDRRGRFTHTTDRARAQKFAKLTAESLVERLRKGYGLTAKVEPEVL